MIKDNNPTNQRVITKSDSIYLLIGTAILIISISQLVSWHTRTNFLKYYMGNSIHTVQYTTSLLFLISGFALIAYSAGKNLWVNVLASLLIILPVIILVLYLLRFGWNIDDIPMYFFSDFNNFKPGHAAPNVAICFILTGVALLLMVNFNHLRNRANLIGLVGSGIFAISGAAFVGYLSGLDVAHDWFGATAMALATSLLFLVICIPIMISAWQMLISNENSGNITWFAIPICICLMTISACVWLGIRVQQDLYIKKMQITEIQNITGDFEYFVQKDMQINAALATQVEGLEAKKKWEAAFHLYLSHNGVQKFVWFDSDLRLQWSTAEKSPQTKYTNQHEQIENMRTAQREHKSIVGALKSNENDLIGFAIYSPIYAGDRFEGLIGTYYDLRTVLNLILYDINAQTFDVTFYSDSYLIYSNNESHHLSKIPNSKASNDLISYQGVQFQVSVLAIETLVIPPLANLPNIVLLEGLLTLLLFFGIIYYAQTARRRAQKLTHAISELHQTQNCLINQEKLASLGALIAGISHELKSPLNYIQNFSELSVELLEDTHNLMDSASLNQEVKKKVENNLQTLGANLKSVHDQGQKATQTIQRMLTHARTKTNEATLVDLNELLDEYMKLSYLGIRSKDPSFFARFEKNYDKPYGNVKVHAQDMSRVFLNLFDNAYYAMSSKRKRLGDVFVPVMSVKTEQKGNKFEIHIRDNGSGIPENAKSNLFTPFFTTKPTGEGTGLGLMLTRNIVDEHGGTLNVDSMEGEFTEFTISLPSQKIE